MAKSRSNGLSIRDWWSNGNGAACGWSCDNCGTGKMAGRGRRLNDEWVAERRVQLLIDKGQFAAAKELLLSTEFQKVHQTSNRTGLWRQICQKLQSPAHRCRGGWAKASCAHFGAYREYD